MYILQDSKWRNSSSKNLDNLLENLLQWGQSQTGQMTYSPETMDLSAVVQQAASLMGEYAQNKEIKLCPGVDEDTLVYADRNMVLTILRNLISNGIKFTEGGGEVKVTAVDIDDWVQVSVTDTGIGITPQYKKELFKLDSTLSQKGTRGETGTGLGLIICKELVEKHGGDLRVESQIHQGSSFSFTLPKANKNI